MRRALAAIITVVAVMAAVVTTQVNASDGPGQATATSVSPSDTPDPVETLVPATMTPQTNCPTVDPFCRKAFLPLSRLDPSPTPNPTATNEPEIVCRERLYDGSFEEEESGWSVSKTKALDYAAPRVGTDIWRAAHGDRMMYLEPTFDSSVGVYSRPIPGFRKGAVTSAKLAFSWAFGSYDRRDYADNLRAFVYERKGEDAVAVWVRYNQDWVNGWTRATVDVSNLVNRGWSEIQVTFTSRSNASLETWWDVDAVSLEVCAWE